MKYAKEIHFVENNAFLKVFYIFRIVLFFFTDRFSGVHLKIFTRMQLFIHLISYNFSEKRIVFTKKCTFNCINRTFILDNIFYSRVTSYIHFHSFSKSFIFHFAGNKFQHQIKNYKWTQLLASILPWARSHVEQFYFDIPVIFYWTLMHI